MVDLKPLLYPNKEPSPRVMAILDTFSWALPILSAVLATAGGCAAWTKADQVAAILGIAAGISGAIGVLTTNWASRVRDHRIEHAKTIAEFGAAQADHIARSLPSDW